MCKSWVTIAGSKWTMFCCALFTQVGHIKKQFVLWMWKTATNELCWYGNAWVGLSASNYYPGSADKGIPKIYI